MSAHTLLLVDDDPAVHELLAAVLHRPEWHIDSAYDGLEGLVRAKERPYDMVLTDVRMPGMSGLEVCQELRKDPATAKIPVIILTALAHEADITAGLAAGADDYIVKPFSTSDFSARVNTVVARVQSEAASRSDGWPGQRRSGARGADASKGLSQ